MLFLFCFPYIWQYWYFLHIFSIVLIVFLFAITYDNSENISRGLFYH